MHTLLFKDCFSKQTFTHILHLIFTYILMVFFGTPAHTHARTQLLCITSCSSYNHWHCVSTEVCSPCPLQTRRVQSAERAPRHEDSKDRTNLECHSNQISSTFRISNTNILWFQIRLEYWTVSRCLPGIDVICKSVPELPASRPYASIFFTFLT